MLGYTLLELLFGGGVTIAPRRLLALVLLCAGVIGLLVLPGVAAQTTTDYDRDNDGLIEVKNLEQLNAIRWDLNGDGVADNPSTSSDPDDPDAPSQEQAYAAAFPNPATGMGCRLADDDGDANTPDVPVCIGYELTANLNFSGSTWSSDPGWTPIADSAYFTATFDGNNRSITNLYINRPDADYQGLFGYFGGPAAEIRNVRLRDVNVTGNERVGGLVGFHQGGGVSDNPAISNSSASGTVSGQQWIGGLVGQNRGTISDSSASVAVSGQQQIGGLVGRNHSGAISASSASGAVSGQQWIGGLVGTNAAGATIISSHATGNVTGTDPSTSSDIGGLVGYNGGTIEDSYHKTGTVSGYARIGGLVGYSYEGTISANSYASSTVMGNSEVGGLVGKNEGGTISTSHATGTVTGTDMTQDSGRVGGLVGENNGGTIEDSYHETGAVTGHREVGGLVGLNAGTTSTISTSHATGNVTGTETTFRSTGIGGLVGKNEDGTIRASHATGTVTGSERSGEYTGENTGGLVGANQAGTIRASYSTGTVRGEDNIGGLVGANTYSGSSTGTIEDSYHETGAVTGHHKVGGLVGWNEHGTIRASYSKGTVKGAEDIGGLVGRNKNGTVLASYATGDVIGTGMSRVAGGLVGRNWRGASIIASYARGAVSATGGVPDPDNAGAFLPINVGGLVGYNDTTTNSFPYRAATVEHSYWDTETSRVQVGIGNDDVDDNGAIDGSETAQDGATGKTTAELQTPTAYTDSDPDTEDIYANWNLDLDNADNDDMLTTGGDDPWDFGTTSQYPVLKVDFTGDGKIDADDIDPQRRSSGGGGGGGGGGGSSSKKSSGGGSRAPSPPPVPTRSPIIGSTPAATAMELAGDLLVLQRHDQPGIEIEVGVGWISRDGQRIIVIGFVRDGDLGQTYAVVRREGDGQVVRRWIAPDSPLVYAVPWALVNTQYTFPVGVILAIPLDDQYPWPHMLTRRFDGGDDRILAYDAGLGQWRHVPDLATFQALGYYWCNVTAADAGFFDRITLGPPYPASTVPARVDYPVCQT